VRLRCILMQAWLFLACALAASTAVVLQCVLLRACNRDHTCEPWGKSWVHVRLCSFKTVPLHSTKLRVYETSAESSFCPRGETHSVSSAGAFCVPVRPYPSAIVQEIIQANKTTPHEKYCGAWLESSPVPLQGVVRYGFKDSESRSEALRTAAETSLDVSAQFSSSSNTGKFVELCRRDARSQTALLRSNREAFLFLLEQAGRVTDARSGMVALGRLAAHKCPAPIALGVRIRGTQHLVGIEDGPLLRPEEVHGALLEVGATQEDAVAGRDAVSSARSRAENSRKITASELSEILRAAFGADLNFVTLRKTPNLDAFVRLMQESNETGRHFISATAAFCCKAALYGLATRGAASTSRHQLLARLSPARAEDASEAGFAATEEDVFRATSGTVQRTVHSGGCVGLARSLFVEETESWYFDSVVSNYLYSRMEKVVERVRWSLVRLFEENESVRRVYARPSDVAHSINTTSVRIPGAPIGSWAGAATRALSRHPPFRSDDGVVVAVLKTTASVFTQTFTTASLLIGDSDKPAKDPTLCDVGFAYDPLAANAYHLMDCVYVLLPMCRRGFADALYDLDSLYSRFGYIVGHELAHAERLHQRSNDDASRLVQLSHPVANGVVMTETALRERLADIYAVLGIVGSGLVTADAFCAHVSQVWCGKYAPMARVVPGTADHPPPNLRGDALCRCAFALSPSNESI
jgi:hypothetical protein